MIYWRGALVRINYGSGRRGHLSWTSGASSASIGLHLNDITNKHNLFLGLAKTGVTLEAASAIRAAPYFTRRSRFNAFEVGWTGTHDTN